MNYSSQLIERAIDEFSKLPGIGQRSALRFVLHLLNRPQTATENFAHALLEMRQNIKFCSECHAVSDTEMCSICADAKRQHNIICVVENIRDIMAIEQTNQYRGLYHVLGGVISPVDGVGVNDLTIQHLVHRVEKGNIREIILALPTTMEGDTTNFYLNKVLQPFNVEISTIARGVAIGDNLEYADEITLGRSILHRIPFSELYQNKK